MSANLHVLVYGSMDSGVCDYYRFGILREALLANGVEIRALTSIHYRSGEGRDYLEAADDEDLTLDRGDLDWADVLVFRRFYQTVWNCSRCPGLTGTREEVEAHGARTGHKVAPPDPIVRVILRALEQQSSLLRGRAVIYESDDNLLEMTSWNGVSARMAYERDLVERLLRRADLVTTTTPFLASIFERYNPTVRIIRNAIDLAAYAPPPSTERLPGDPRLVYYGGSGRIRDYEVARSAVERAKQAVPSLRRIWLGTRRDAVATAEDLRVEALVDEAHPATTSVPDFHRLLARMQADIGIAPLVGDNFDRAKSELHWLEYSAVGAATIASRTRPPGPFDVIRDGVDGLVVHGRAAWQDAVMRLARSPQLRADLAGRARERVTADYDISVRAAEWADAYRWAAEHPGRGAAPPQYAGWSEEDAVRDARAGVAYRARRRLAAEVDAAILDGIRARDGRADAIAPSGRLVSVLLPVVGEPPAFVSRALASVASQEHAPVEVVVASNPDWPRAEVDVPAGLDLRWVAWEPVTFVADRDNGTIALARALNAAAAAARGAWIVPLSPEGELLPSHVGGLLEVATEHALEFVYGQSLVDFGDGASLELGSWPPGPDFVLTLATELYARPLLEVVPYEEESWREGETVGWAHWHRLIAAGVRMASVEVPVHRLAPLAAA